MPSSTWRWGAATLLVASTFTVVPLTGTAYAAPSGSSATKVAVKVGKTGATRATVKLTVKTKGKAARSKRKVTLQKRAGNRWVKVSGVKAKRTSKKGVVSFKVPRSTSKVKWRAKVTAKGRYRGVAKTFTVGARPTAPAPAPTPTPIPTPTPTPTPSPITGISAAFAPATQNAGPLSRFTVSGTVTGTAPAGREVVVETKNGADWIPVARTTTSAGGAWSTTFPADWLYRLPVRARSTASGHTVVTVPQQVSTTPAWTPSWESAEAPYHPARTPIVRWDACDGAITYKLNLDKSAGVTRAHVDAALADITLATGLRFSYAGTTTAHAFSQADNDDTSDGERADGTDLLISFSDDEDTDSPYGPDFSEYSQTIGYGGVAYWTSPYYDASGLVQPVIYAAVAFNVGFNDTYLNPARERELHSVVKHEIAHAIGLGHADADKTDQVMAPYLNPDPIDFWGAGDLLGLAAVGASKGCIRSTPPNGLTALRSPFPKPSIGFVGYEDTAAPDDTDHHDR